MKILTNILLIIILFGLITCTNNPDKNSRNQIIPEKKVGKLKIDFENTYFYILENDKIFKAEYLLFNTIACFKNYDTVSYKIKLRKIYYINESKCFIKFKINNEIVRAPVEPFADASFGYSSRNPIVEIKPGEKIDVKLIDRFDHITRAFYDRGFKKYEIIKYLKHKVKHYLYLEFTLLNDNTEYTYKINDKVKYKDE